MLGPDQPVILHLLDIPPAAQSLEGVKMELIDAALPLLAGQPIISLGLRTFHALKAFSQFIRATQCLLRTLAMHRFLQQAQLLSRLCAF